MLSFTALVLSGLAAVANAHFQLQYPLPRGVFNMDNEVTFCDGYDSVATNRTQFPTGQAFISLNSEHPLWTAAVYISNSSNPTSFDQFTQITPFFQEAIEGLFCMNFDLSTTNATGLTSGENVTMQILYNGGDGNLYQCADLTLSDTATTGSATCSNTTASSSAFGLSAPSTGSLFGLAGLALALL